MSLFFLRITLPRNMMRTIAPAGTCPGESRPGRRQKKSLQRCRAAETKSSTSAVPLCLPQSPATSHRRRPFQDNSFFCNGKSRLSLLVFGSGKPLRGQIKTACLPPRTIRRLSENGSAERYIPIQAFQVVITYCNDIVLSFSGPAVKRQIHEFYRRGPQIPDAPQRGNAP